MGTSEKLSNYCNVHISAAKRSSLLAVSPPDTSSSRVRAFRSKCEHIVTSHSFSEVPMLKKLEYRFFAFLCSSVIAISAMMFASPVFASVVAYRPYSFFIVIANFVLTGFIVLFAVLFVVGFFMWLMGRNVDNEIEELEMLL